MPDRYGWVVRAEGGNRDLSRHLSQADAVWDAKRRAGGGEIILHGRSGKVSPLGPRAEADPPSGSIRRRKQEPSE